MELFNRHSGVRRAIAVVVAVLSAAGCMRWKPVLDAGRYVPVQRPRLLRVTLVSQEQVELYQPTFVDGQLVNHSATPLSIPVRDVVSARALVPDGPRTALFVGALVVGAVVATVVTLQEFRPMGTSFISLK